MEPTKENEKEQLMGLEEIQEIVWSGKPRGRISSERKEGSPMSNPAEH